MIPQALYPTAPWPLSKIGQHPCMSLLIADANSPNTKRARRQTLYAVIAVVDDVKKRPEMYAKARPLGRAFATVPNMPPGCDLGALLDELCKLKLFAIEHSEDGAMLVAAESTTAKAEPAKAARKTAPVAGRVPVRAAERLSAKAQSRGVSLSALVSSVLTEFAETD